jgi:hypothetical protein
MNRKLELEAALDAVALIWTRLAEDADGMAAILDAIEDLEHAKVVIESLSMGLAFELAALHRDQALAILNASRRWILRLEREHDQHQDPPDTFDT